MRDHAKPDELAECLPKRQPDHLDPDKSTVGVTVGVTDGRPDLAVGVADSRPVGPADTRAVEGPDTRAVGRPVWIAVWIPDDEPHAEPHFDHRDDNCDHYRALGAGVHRDIRCAVPVQPQLRS